MSSLERLTRVFEVGGNEIVVEPDLARKAMIPLQRMLDFSTRKVSGD